VTAEELREVERMVNKLIRQNHPLEENREATMEEANAMGAIALFGEKYGDKVRVVKFGDSVELCGGTHTSATGTLGVFKILGESAISAGVRRIEAVTAERAEEVLYGVEDQIHNVAELLNNPKVEVAIKKMIESNEALQKELEQLQALPWFRAALKYGLAIKLNDATTRKVLEDFVSGNGDVIDCFDPALLKNIIQIIVLTASKVKSSTTATGAGAPVAKNVQIIQQVKAAIDEVDDWEW
jgi:alanyl-tRNA synthetase